MGDIRDDVIDQAYTIKNLKALREADAAKIRQQWADKAERGETDDG